MKFKRSSLKSDETRTTAPTPEPDIEISPISEPVENPSLAAPSPTPGLKEEHSLDDLAANVTNMPEDVDQNELDEEPTPINKTPNFQKPQNPTNFNPSHFPSTGVYSSRKNGGGNKLHVLILMILGVLVIGATVYLLKGGDISQLKTKVSPTPAPTAQALATPVPTQTPSLDRAKVKIRVLNGTSKSGLAGSVGEKLKGLGYQLEKTANATNSAFTQTVVRVKEGTASATIVDQLTKDLASDYSATPSTPLKASDTVDAEIILGIK